MDTYNIWQWGMVIELIGNISNYHQSILGKSWYLEIEEIDLSNNYEITDKYLHLLSQKIIIDQYQCNKHILLVLITIPSNVMKDSKYNYEYA